MSSALRFVVIGLFGLGVPLAFGLAHGPALGEDAQRPARAEDSSRPPGPAASESGHACLDQRERRAEAGKLVPLATAIRAVRTRMPGSTVVRARLCRGSEGLVYVLTVLARDGKVARLTVDAVKGTLVGGL
jgi:hypothetical protein